MDENIYIHPLKCIVIQNMVISSNFLPFLGSYWQNHMLMFIVKQTRNVINIFVLNLR